METVAMEKGKIVVVTMETIAIVPMVTSWIVTVLILVVTIATIPAQIHWCHLPVVMIVLPVMNINQ
jgi:hypothetical protein